MYDIIRTKNGREELVYTDHLPKARRRLKQLQQSAESGAIFSLRESSTEKFIKIHKDRSH